MASDQHHPASSRATATLAMTGFLLRAVKVSHRWWSRWLPAWPRALAAGPGRGCGQVPAGAHDGAGVAVGAPVVPGGLDQQPAGVTVAGLGDRSLGALSA